MDGDKIMVDDPSYAETLVNPNKIREFLEGAGDYKYYSLEDRRRIWNKWSAFRTKKKVRISFKRNPLKSFDFSKLDINERWDFSFCDFHPDAHWPVNMTYWIFVGAQLDSVHWGGADLEMANLSFASLKNAFLEKATLSGVKFIGAYLRGADLRRSLLSVANFSNADVRGTNFSNVDLQNANFTEADIRAADFTNANLQGAKFEKNDAREANFTGADLRGIIFERGNLIRVDFSGADIRGTNFETSSFKHTIFDKAIYNNKTTWPTGTARDPDDPDDSYKRGLVYRAY